MSSKLIATITTIQRPTECVLRLAERTRQNGASILVMGDKKGPPDFPVDGAEFFSLDDQLRLPFQLATKLPTGHYCRKNLGYLIAIDRQAECLYETDDDNAPADGWGARPLSVTARMVEPRPWLNVFRLFTDELIWPRGFPLELVRDPSTYSCGNDLPLQTVDAPIQQGLVDGSPDVDAVWRLILDRPFTFERRESVWLPPGTCCPFNSQSTWWWPPAFPLLYLPSYCTFRMTDIWRSFVAQRCLWEAGYGIAFHAPEMIQDRNVHNLIRDLTDEMPGYEGNVRMLSILAELRLDADLSAMSENLIRCYEALIGAGFFPAEEMALVKAWNADLAR
jgi:hypothetical protein